MPEETGRQSKSLVRGSSILNVFSSSRSGLTRIESADTTDFAPSTVHRLLAILEKQAFLSIDYEIGRWRIGISGFRIGNVFVRSCDYVAELRPLMIELSDRTGETINVPILSGSTALFVSQIESAIMMGMISPLDSLSPLHASSAGKASLAALVDQEERAELMVQLNFDAMTHKTLRSRASLSEEIECILAEGWSYNRGEYVDGMRCVAALVFGELGAPICALSISGPSVLLTERVLAGHGDAVSKTAQMAIQFLGGVAPKHWSSHA
ncbi:MAG: IclR family transcriptional regulator [Pseudomonadota bacterium]|nr:IclR family transcriptional regulator [Pseudomonadota bacterium]